MATGDIKGNIALLERLLRHLKYPAAVDDVGLMLGDPLASLPILNFALLKYSRHVAAYILSVGVELQAKTDEGFVKGAFRLCRDHLGVRTVLTPAQFLEQGYAERKVLLLCDVVKAAKELHTAGAKQERAKLQASFRQSPAKMQQLSASPTPKVDWGSLSSTSRLKKLPNITATDASQSIFAPMGSVEKHRSPASKGASPAGNRHSHQQQQQQRVGFSSPPAAAPSWACDTSPSQDQLVAAGLMPLSSSWRTQAAAAEGHAAGTTTAAAAAAAAAGGGGADAVPAARGSKGPQDQQVSAFTHGSRRAGGAQIGQQQQQQLLQQQQQLLQQQQQRPLHDSEWSAPGQFEGLEGEQEQELQQDSQWTLPAGLATSAQQSPAVALPQQQVWIPLQQQQREEGQWHGEQQQWQAFEQLQQQQQRPGARACLWPRQQPAPQAAAAAVEAPTQQAELHEPSRRLPPAPLLQRHQHSKVPQQQHQQQQQQDRGHEGSLQQQQPVRQQFAAAAQQAGMSGAVQAGVTTSGGDDRSPQQQQRHQSRPSRSREPLQEELQQRQQEQHHSSAQQQQQQQQDQHQQQGQCSSKQTQQLQEHSQQQQLQQQDQLQQQQEQHEELLLVQEEQQLALLDAKQTILQLQEALSRAEAQLQEHKSAAGRFEEAVCARMTVLEGRVKLMEAQVANSNQCCGACHGRQQQAAVAAAAAGAGRLAAALAGGGGGGSAQKSWSRDAWLQQSPLKSPGGPAAGSSRAGSINWRAAASAAASAVVTGLSSSPQPAWHSPSVAAAAAAAAASHLHTGPRQQLYASPQSAATQPAPSGVEAGTSRLANRAAAGGGGGGAEPSTAVRDRQPEDPAAMPGGNAPSESTSKLIHKLASRAAEAQRLLESLHVKQ